MCPPGVVVVLVHQVLPGHQLEEEHAGADQGRDHGPARHKEVARVVADHVIQGQAEAPDVTRDIKYFPLSLIMEIGRNF